MSDLTKRIAALSPEKRELLRKQLDKQQNQQERPQIARQARTTNIFPASFTQQRMWLLDQLEPGTSSYTISTAVQLKGALDVAAMERSLNALVQRHESLRTTFTTQGGSMVQVIAPPASVVLPLIDLSTLPASERKAAAMRSVNEEFHRPFDLAQGPLLRVTLLRLDHDDHVLIAAMHHIISDGWSLNILIKELGALYRAEASQTSAALPELPIQYADFACWQQDWLQGKVLEEQLSYWREQLGHSATVLELPTDYPRAAVQRFLGKTAHFSLSPETSAGIKALSRQEGVTTFMLLLAAFQTLLYRYTGQADINVGTPVAGRDRIEVEPLIGCFVNTLVMHTNLSGNPTFRELLGRVRQTAVGAYAHQDLPLEKVLDALDLERDPSRTPLFQVMFNLQTASRPAVEMPGLSISPLEIEHGIISATSQCDLTLDVEDTPAQLLGSLTYTTTLFEDDTITRMLKQFQTLLENIVADPNQGIDQLGLLTPAERYQLIEAWNTTAGIYADEQGIHGLFEAQVARTPEAIAVVCGQQQMTYQQLNSRANQIAHQLQAYGVGPEVLVGVCMERSLDLIAALLGVLKAGAAYVPIEPTYPPERQAFILADTQAPVLLTQTVLVERLPAHGAQTICLDQLALDLQSPENTANPEQRSQSGNLAYVIYTSGSTGTPKGVAVTHRSLVNFTTAAHDEYALTSDDRMLQFASISFDTSAEEIYPCLTSGATLVLRNDTMLGGPDVFLRTCEAWGLTVLDLPTAYWHELVAYAADHALTFPSSLRQIIIGGEQALADRVAAWPNVGSHIRLVNTYGPTESTIVATLATIGTDDSSVPIGRPIQNIQTYVLDRRLQPVPVGVPGELYLAGAGLARGYLNQPGLTAERFVPHLFSRVEGARLYRTGDLVRYRPDGKLEFLGRTDQQVKLRGYRIELGEIEAALRQHAAVRDAVVMLREDRPGEKRLAAYLTPALDMTPDAADLRQFIDARLPAYMLPSAFVVLESLPLTASGKIDYRKLPAPASAQPETKQEFVAPSTPTEEMLAEIWIEVLRIEQVSIHDNFFELGGHSLLATQVVYRLNEAFQIDLPLRKIFEEPTIARLVVVIEDILLEEIGHLTDEEALYLAQDSTES